MNLDRIYEFMGEDKNLTYSQFIDKYKNKFNKKYNQGHHIIPVWVDPNSTGIIFLPSKLHAIAHFKMYVESGFINYKDLTAAYIILGKKHNSLFSENELQFKSWINHWKSHRVSNKFKIWVRNWITHRDYNPFKKYILGIIVYKNKNAFKFWLIRSVNNLTKNKFKIWVTTWSNSKNLNDFKKWTANWIVNNSLNPFKKYISITISHLISNNFKKWIANWIVNKPEK